jgi:glycerate kinase
MKIIIAPDSFKESLSAMQACLAIKRGLVTLWPTADYELFPIADGGEGTVEALDFLTGGRTKRDTLTDP